MKPSKLSTTTQPQKTQPHHRKNTKTQPQNYDHTTTKTQPSHRKNTTTPPQEYHHHNPQIKPMQEAFLLSKKPVENDKTHWKKPERRLLSTKSNPYPTLWKKGNHLLMSVPFGGEHFGRESFFRSIKPPIGILVSSLWQGFFLKVQSHHQQ